MQTTIALMIFAQPESKCRNGVLITRPTSLVRDFETRTSADKNWLIAQLPWTINPPIIDWPKKPNLMTGFQCPIHCLLLSQLSEESKMMDNSMEKAKKWIPRRTRGAIISKILEFQSFQRYWGNIDWTFLASINPSRVFNLNQPSSFLCQTHMHTKLCSPPCPFTNYCSVKFL